MLNSTVVKSYKYSDGVHKIRNFPNAGRKCRHLFD